MSQITERFAGRARMRAGFALIGAGSRSPLFLYSASRIVQTWVAVAYLPMIALTIVFRSWGGAVLVRGATPTAAA